MNIQNSSIIEVSGVERPKDRDDRKRDGVLRKVTRGLLSLLLLFNAASCKPGGEDGRVITLGSSGKGHRVTVVHSIKTDYLYPKEDLSSDLPSCKRSSLIDVSDRILGIDLDESIKAYIQCFRNVLLDAYDILREILTSQDKRWLNENNDVNFSAFKIDFESNVILKYLYRQMYGKELSEEDYMQDDRLYILFAVVVHLMDFHGVGDQRDGVRNLVRKNEVLESLQQLWINGLTFDLKPITETTIKSRGDQDGDIQVIVTREIMIRAKHVGSDKSLRVELGIYKEIYNEYYEDISLPLPGNNRESEKPHLALNVTFANGSSYLFVFPLEELVKQVFDDGHSDVEPNPKFLFEH
ncbi:hypothetical protein D6810_02135 [Candidatus Dojkabacteria bacterium]|uniref:Uncharacterized protein n=1 Tax=Candidatus Dojkabacteria bacterium TaxID=2099670 RepID=A0A3M0Z097_9BACT|nr:MAG: hypothetical protein D6810_02135 [Candidatus Dojkabacteria bacterium]